MNISYIFEYLKFRSNVFNRTISVIIHNFKAVKLFADFNFSLIKRACFCLGSEQRKAFKYKCKKHNSLTLFFINLNTTENDTHAPSYTNI